MKEGHGSQVERSTPCRVGDPQEEPGPRPGPPGGETVTPRSEAESSPRPTPWERALRKSVPNKLCFHGVCSDTLVLKVSSPSLKLVSYY